MRHKKDSPPKRVQQDSALADKDSPLTSPKQILFSMMSSGRSSAQPNNTQVPGQKQKERRGAGESEQQELTIHQDRGPCLVGLDPIASSLPSLQSQSVNWDQVYDSDQTSAPEEATQGPVQSPEARTGRPTSSTPSDSTSQFQSGREDSNARQYSPAVNIGGTIQNTVYASNKPNGTHMTDSLESGLDGPPPKRARLNEKESLPMPPKQAEDNAARQTNSSSFCGRQQGLQARGAELSSSMANSERSEPLRPIQGYIQEILDCDDRLHFSGTPNIHRPIPRNHVVEYGGHAASNSHSTASSQLPYFFGNWDQEYNFGGNWDHCYTTMEPILPINEPFSAGHWDQEYNFGGDWDHCCTVMEPNLSTNASFSAGNWDQEYNFGGNWDHCHTTMEPILPINEPFSAGNWDLEYNSASRTAPTATSVPLFWRNRDHAYANIEANVSSNMPSARNCKLAYGAASRPSQAEKSIAGIQHCLAGSALSEQARKTQVSLGHLNLFTGTPAVPV